MKSIGDPLGDFWCDFKLFFDPDNLCALAKIEYAVPPEPAFHPPPSTPPKEANDPLEPDATTPESGGITYVTNEYITHPTTIFREVVREIETVRESGGGAAFPDLSGYLTSTLFDRQIDATHYSLEKASAGIADNIATAVSTRLLTVSGSATIDGSLSAGSFTATDATASSAFAGTLTVGNLGIGTTTPQAPLHVSASGGTMALFESRGATNANLTIKGERWTSLGINTHNNSAGVSSEFWMRKATGTIDAPDAVSQGHRLALMLFAGHDGTAASRVAASIASYVDGAVATNSVPGRIEFSTQSVGGTGNNTPIRFVIDASGRTNVIAPTTTPEFSQLHLRSQRTAIAAGNLIGGLGFQSNDTNLTAPGLVTASIQALANEAHTASALGSDIVFSTTASGGTTMSERMRISGSGNIGIGTTSPTALLHLYYGASGAPGTATFDAFRIEGDGSVGIDIITPDVNTGRLNFGSPSNSRNAAIWSSNNGGNPYLSFRVGNTEYLRLASGGNVGIGTSSPDYKLTVAGHVAPDAGNLYTLGASGRDWECVYYSGGSIGTCASDAELKTAIAPLSFASASSTALAKVAALQLRQFAFKAAPENRYHGLIAQEVEAVAPELVTTGSNGYKAVRYGDIPWLLLEAVQDLYAIVTNFAERIVSREIVVNNHTVMDNFCIGRTCITEEEFRQLLDSTDLDEPAPSPGGADDRRSVPAAERSSATSTMVVEPNATTSQMLVPDGPDEGHVGDPRPASLEANAAPLLPAADGDDSQALHTVVGETPDSSAEAPLREIIAKPAS